MLLENKYFLNDRYIFDPNTKSLIDRRKEDEVTWLGTNESNILKAFIEHPNEILSRDKIHELVWTSNGFHVDESSVIQAISMVRKLLKDSAKAPRYIKTVPKHGYQFIASKEVVTEDLTPTLLLEQRENSQEKTPQDTSKTEVESKIKPSWIKWVLPLLVISCGLVWTVSQLDNKYAQLYQIESISGVPVYSLSEVDRSYQEGSSTRYCIGKYLASVDDLTQIERIITTLSSNNDLVLNVVKRNLADSFTFTLIANKGQMKSFCDVRFASDEK